MNSICIIGRLTAEPELRTTQSGTTLASLSVAVDKYQGKGKEKGVDFFPCLAFGERANLIMQYFHKGDRIGLHGSMTSSRYEKEGQKHTRWTLMIDSIDFLQGRRDSGPSDKPGAVAQSSQMPAESAVSAYTAYTVEDEDLPF